MRTKTTLACALTAFVAVAGGTAQATGLIHTGDIAKGAVTLSRLAPNVQKLVGGHAKNGVNGVNGTDGLPGAKGATGATGAMGGTGVIGATGVPGLKGDKGDTGEQGLKGLHGDKGDAGLPGADGATGLQGDLGATGATGATGAAGATGAVGANGLDSDAVRTVTAGHLNGFVLAPDGDNTAAFGGSDAPGNGSVAFVTAADAPKGTSVLDMQTTTGKSVVTFLPSAAGRLLSELTSFGYASKVIASPNPDYDVTAQIEVLNSSAPAFKSGYTTVVFEPYNNGNVGVTGWHRNDVVHGKVWSTKALPSGDCSQAVPCAFSTFVAENPKATIMSAPKFRIGQNSGTPATDAGEYQVDDVIYGFGSALNFDLGA
jgi:hypothetical protein